MYDELQLSHFNLKVPYITPVVLDFLTRSQCRKGETTSVYYRLAGRTDLSTHMAHRRWTPTPAQPTRRRLGARRTPWSNTRSWTGRKNGPLEINRYGYSGPPVWPWADLFSLLISECFTPLLCFLLHEADTQRSLLCCLSVCPSNRPSDCLSVFPSVWQSHFTIPGSQSWCLLCSLEYSHHSSLSCV